MEKNRTEANDHFYEKTMKSRSIFEGKVISVQVDEVQLPDGQLSNREIVRHPGAVTVMPFTDDGRLVLVRQYRKPLGKEIYELPAGKLEQGEDPALCARRELEEETGYTAKQLHYVTSFYTSPGFADEIIYVYEAAQLTEGQIQLDEDEFVQKRLITLEEGLDLLAQHKIHDAKTVYALTYWQNQRLEEQLRSR